MDLKQRVALVLPTGVPIKLLVGVQLQRQRLRVAGDLCQLFGRQVCELRNQLNPQVQRIHVAAGDRQVWRRLHPRRRGARMKWVNEHERCAVLATKPGSHVAQVGQVANPPRPMRSRGIQLRRHTPALPISSGRWHLQTFRADDEGAPVLNSADFRNKLMPPKW